MGDNNEENDRDKLIKLNAMYELCREIEPNENYESLTELQPSDQRWLSDTIEYFANNAHPLRRIEANIKKLQQIFYRHSTEDMNEFVNALQELQEITESLDLARKFVDLDGLSVIETLLDNDNRMLCCETSNLLGTINQNNDFCQLESVRRNIIERLVDKICKEADLQLLKKLIFALSCTVRGNREAFERFINTKGFDVLFGLVRDSPSSTLRCKIAFFIYCLISEIDIILFGREMIKCIENFTICLIQLSSFRVQEAEHMLGCLYLIFKKFPFINNTERRDELIAKLKEEEDKLKADPDLEQTKEIRFYIEELIRMIGARPQTSSLVTLSLALTN